MNDSFIYFPSIAFPYATAFGLRFAEAEGRHDLRARSSTDLGSFYFQTGLHESIHEDILYRTSFGNYHRLLRALADSEYAPDIVIESSEQLIDRFHNVSQVAHECVATYCAIKGSDKADEGRLIGELSGTYRAFFLRLAGAIDTAFQSTFVQYLAGYKFCEYAFMCDIAPLFDAWDGKAAFEIPEDLRPDVRLKRLETVFDSERWRQVKTELYGRLEMSPEVAAIKAPFNFDREEEWDALDIDQQGQMNSLVERELEQLLYDRLRPLPGTAHRRRFFEGFSATVLTWHKARFLALIDTASFCPRFAGVLPHGDSVHRAITSGAAYITNRRKVNCHYGESAEHRTRWGSSSGYSVLVWNFRLARGVPRDGWMLMHYTVVGRDTMVAELPPRWLDGEMGKAKANVRKGAATYNLPFSAIVVRLWTPLSEIDLAAFEQALSKVSDLFEDKDGPVIGIRPHTLFWYMDGNVILWIEWLIESAKLQGGRVTLRWCETGFLDHCPEEDQDPAEQARAKEGRRFVLMVHLSGMPGFWLRVVDCYSATWLLPATIALQARGIVGELSHDDEEGLTTGLSQVQAFIDRTWDVH